MSPEVFADAVRRMLAVQGGDVKVTDWYPTDGRRPYRYAIVRVSTPNAYAPGRVGELTHLAIAIGNGASMNVWTHYDDGATCLTEVVLARDLDDAELRPVDSVTLSVSLETSGPGGGS